MLIFMLNCFHSLFTSKLLNTLATYKTFSPYISLSVSWCLSFSKPSTFTAFSTAPEVEMHLLFHFLIHSSLWQFLFYPIMLNILLKVSIFCLKVSVVASYLTVTTYICILQLCIHIINSYS